jgi:hypothetical protein
MRSLLNKIKIGIVVFFVASIGFMPIFQAQAQFGGPTVVVGDIPEAIEKGVREALAAAFSSFAQKYMEDLITKVEENYKIANFLYYSDALVTGQYLQDYLDKYVQKAQDQRMVLAFVPQFNCGQQVNMTQEYKQLARQHLGFEPATLDTNDPQFYQKLSRMGDFLSSPSGWEAKYEDLAKEALAEAKRAADNEINSPGLKTARDINTGSISATINSIAQNQSAAIKASLDLGTIHVDQIAANIARNQIYKYINKFAFKGAVFKEQTTCVPFIQTDPIIPNPDAPEAPDVNQTYLKASPQFVNTDNSGLDAALKEAKFNVSWDMTQLKGQGAAKARFLGDNKWVSLADNAERRAYYAGSAQLQSFNCHKLVLVAYNSRNEVVGKPLVEIVYNDAGSGPNDEDPVCNAKIIPEIAGPRS